MNLRDAFLHGFRVGIRQWRIAAIVYFIQLCLALTLGMQVYEVLHASIGNSLEISKLLKGYDHTVITDFLKIHGASITPLIGQLRWLLLVWLIFSVFIDGGLLYCAALPGQASGRSFWQGAATYFFSFLKIGLFFLALALVWTVVIWLPAAMFLEPSLEFFPSEKYTVWSVLLLLAVWLTGLAALLVWSLLSRLHYLHDSSSIIGSLKNGAQVFQKNKIRFLGLLAAFAGIQMVLVVIYLWLEAYSGMTSPVLILVFFVVQQAFVFARIQIRQMMYAGMSLAYRGGE